ADLELADVRVRLASVVNNTVDETALRSLEAGLPGEIRKVGRLHLAFGDQLLCRYRVDVRTVDLLRHLDVPAVRLRFGNLAPAAHLRQIPDRIAVIRIGRVVAEEHVEVRLGTLVALFIFEGAGHAVGDD